MKLKKIFIGIKGVFSNGRNKTFPEGVLISGMIIPGTRVECICPEGLSRVGVVNSFSIAPENGDLGSIASIVKLDLLVFRTPTNPKKS